MFQNIKVGKQTKHTPTKNIVESLPVLIKTIKTLMPNPSFSSNFNCLPAMPTGVLSAYFTVTEYGWQVNRYIAEGKQIPNIT